MGPCSSTPKTHHINPNYAQPIYQPQNNNVMYNNNNVQVQNQPYIQKQSEEFYYQNVQTSTQFGKNEFGPNEKIQMNFGVRNSLPGQRYSAIVSLSYDNSGNPNSFQQIGVLSEEICDGNGSLDFKISLLIDYFFEKNQYLLIDVKGFDRSFRINTTLGKVVGSRGQCANLPFGNNTQESLLISANTVKDNNVNLFLDMSVSVSNCNSHHNIFYLVKKKKLSNVVPNVGVNPVPTTQMVGVSNTSTDFVSIYKSEIKQVGNGYVTFKQMKIPTNFLSNGNFDHPFLIEFHNVSTGQILGIHSTTINKILTEKSFVAGSVSVNCISDTVKEYTFMDYLKGGVRLSLSIGIDFTGSNGHPNDDDSLHYQDPRGKPSPYQEAMKSCGDIVAYYDYDQIFPVFGYGASIPNEGTSHCFPITLGNPEIFTIDNVIHAYKEILTKISFSGPTYFAPLIKTILKNISDNFNTNKNSYCILMILTDGRIDDLEETISAIVEASYLPLSFIIVGIGTGDFSNMDFLDADNNILVDRYQKRAARDIVQFVPFRKFANNGFMLAEEVLKEIPRQVVDFYRMNKQLPGDPTL
jgi:hypothetical protein